MTYLVQQLVTQSWYLSGIVARNLQTVTGDQINDGLMLLNALLNFKQIETDLIPYWTYIQIPMVAGQEFYYLPNVAAVESATFNISTVRYPTDFTHRTSYFGSSRVDNIQTLPFNWNFNRGEGGGTIGFYFMPASNYPLKMMVKFFLNNVTLQEDLTNVFSSLASGFVSLINVTNGGTGYTSPPTVTISGNGSGAEAFASIFNGVVTSVYITEAGSGYSQVPTISISGGGGTGATAQAAVTNYTFIQTNNAGYDTSYIEYLRYALAQYMCSEYGIVFNPQSAAILKRYERKLMYMSPPDLVTQKISILTEGTGINYGDVNIGLGYRPS